jgi:hypothetical protein
MAQTRLERSKHVRALKPSASVADALDYLENQAHHKNFRANHPYISLGIEHRVSEIRKLLGITK